jgi:hypothetical protein
MGVRLPPFATMAMIRLLLLLLVFAPPLFAERITIDPSARNFEMRPPVKERVDVFDFSGEFPELENIAINARRKKNVEFYLTGDYPVLESVDYEGSFGVFTGELTGNFPKLALINFICTSCAMDFDLGAEWQSSCEINITGADEDIVLNLPKEVGLVIYTKTGLKGKVIPCEELKKKKRFGVLNKIFENSLAETAPVVLTIHIACGDGRIILN